MFKKKSSKMFMDVKNPFLYNTIFIDRNLARSSIVGDLLGHKGMNVSISSLPVDYKSLNKVKLDLVVYYADINKISLQDVEIISNEFEELPLMVLIDNPTDEIIELLIDRGAHSVVPMGISIDRILAGSICAINISSKMHSLKLEKDKTKIELDNIKLIGHAKSILMKRFNENEPSAHSRLQKMSMNKNKSVHIMAKQIIEAEGLLS